MKTQIYPDRHVELVERCKLGERKAQYELYKHYSKAMFNICMRILNHLGEAEDALQEAFRGCFHEPPSVQAAVDVWGMVEANRGQ